MFSENRISDPSIIVAQPSDDEDELIRFQNQQLFLRHKNSIFVGGRCRDRQPTPMRSAEVENPNLEVASDGGSSESESDEDESSSTSSSRKSRKHLIHIPDLLRGVPSSNVTLEIVQVDAELPLPPSPQSTSDDEPKSVRFKFPECEEISTAAPKRIVLFPQVKELTSVIKRKRRHRPQKGLKAVIPSRDFRSNSLNDLLQAAAIMVTPENSRIVRWKIKLRQHRRKIVLFTFCLLITIFITILFPPDKMGKLFVQMIGIGNQPDTEREASASSLATSKRPSSPLTLSQSDSSEEIESIGNFSGVMLSQHNEKSRVLKSHVNL